MRKLSKTEWVAVVVALVFVGYTVFGSDINGLFSQKSKDNMNQDEMLAGAASAIGGQLVVEDQVEGSGSPVKIGDKLTVHYTLSLMDGTVLQRSKDFGQAFQFTLGAGEVITGWDQGLVGMKVGGVRTLVIPPELAYGENQAGPIPPNSTLVFVVELVSAVAGVPQ